MSVNATAVWRVRPSGSNTNGGGYDPGISGAATDYSQQNSAQASGTHGACSDNTTFTDSTADAFTSAMVGNAMYITGGGATTGWYFVTAYTSSSEVTLDRTPGSVSGGTWNLGGGWADFWTNLNTSSPVVDYNTVYILGSGTPNPASYTYDYNLSTEFDPDITNATITFANDPATPGYAAWPNTTGGMPCVQLSTSPSFAVTTADAGMNLIFEGIFFVADTTGDIMAFDANNGITTIVLRGCVFDQYGNVAQFVGLGGENTNACLIGCEIFSSIIGTASGTALYVDVGNSAPGTMTVIGCNIHDCCGTGIFIDNCDCPAFISDTIIAKCGVNGIEINNWNMVVVKNCTIDGNGENGILIGTSNGNTYAVCILNNIITNHTNSSRAGIQNNGNTDPGIGSTALIDYNVYYNNTQNVENLSLGAHDTVLETSPYVSQATENYTLA